MIANKGVQLNENTLKRENDWRSPTKLPKMYVQVRFELIYGSEISCLIVHLHEKARIDVSFDMILNTQNKEIEKVMVGHEKDAHLDKKKKMIIKITQDVCGKS